MNRTVKSPLAFVMKSPLLRAIFPAGSSGDLVVAFIVVAIVVTMIVPVPGWLLDVLIGLNICAAVLLMVLVMQLHESVALSTFPSILLITTLLRISLNVASTRLILLEGDAGQIIDAFGNVVVGGNLVVGLVVFVILAVIQFIVITKGSERIAEVGARFTLDAMPGKQMAIDMELRGGSITAVDARRLRGELVRESQFFGAMDGAMKFVKGDAIVGIVVTLTNLIGGLAVGVLQRGMSASEAATAYSVLAIGDALVAQVPALLISLTAGLLTTRVSSSASEARNVGREVLTQMLAQPKAWVIASGAMLVFGSLPGMPVAVFAAMAGATFTVGMRSLKGSIDEARLRSQQQASEVATVNKVSPITPFVVRASPALDTSQVLAALNTARRARNRLVEELGLITPTIVAHQGPTEPGCDLEFLDDEIKVFGVTCDDSLCVVFLDPLAIDALGGGVVKDDGVQPDGLQRVWVTQTTAQGLDARQHRVMGFWEYFAFEVENRLVKSGPRHMTMQAVQGVILEYGLSAPEVVKEVDKNVPLLRITEVFQRLLLERVAVRNSRAILNALAEWGARERDVAVLTECVRSCIARQICASVAQGKTIHAFVMDPGFEEEVRVSVRQTAFGDILALDAEVTGSALDGFAQQLRQLPASMRPIIATQQDIRPYVRQLVAGRFPAVAVLSMSELSEDFSMNVVGVFGSASPQDVDVGDVAVEEGEDP
jgi:type III secretion protein V